MMEIHVIELNKTLNGTNRMDEWIRLFNAKTEEDLEMLEAGTKNVGILEAILERSINDKKYREKLYKEYGIK